MGHTHQPATVRLDAGADYLNPGAWFDGYRYAVASDAGVELRRFEKTV